MSYPLTTADEYVKNLYETISIYEPAQLSEEVIAHRLGKSVVYLPVDCTRIGNVLYLDNRLPQKERWQLFGHELCHVLWHNDNQLHLSQSFIDMQERDANNFAYYACVPSAMLLEMTLPDTMQEAVHRIATTFNVTLAFAQKRLEMHISKLYQSTS